MKPGPKPQHVLMTPHLRELIDGLMLGHAWMTRGAESASLYVARFRAPDTWLTFVEAKLERAGFQLRRIKGVLKTRATVELAGERARWYVQAAKRVPNDVFLTPHALAYWFTSAGSKVSNGYAARLSIVDGQATDGTFVANRLGELYAWHAVARANTVRIMRSGDRSQLARLVAHIVPAFVRPKLAFRASQPMTEAQATRRRAPRVLDDNALVDIRTRLEAREPYAAVALDYDVDERYIGKIARCECRAPKDTMPQYRRGATRRLTRDEVLEVLRWLDAGESQSSIGRALGIPQPRVWQLKQKYRSAVA